MGHSSYIYWEIDPVLISLGSISIRWYGFFFALAFLIGYGLLYRIFKNEGQHLQDLDRLLFYVIIGTLIGARLGHCIFYAPDYYFSRPVTILKVWEGGLASHGGAAGILIALYLYARQRPAQTYLWLLDRISIPAVLGGALIRIGNVFNSEIVGLPTTVPWAFVFARVDETPRHPIQLYEAFVYGLIFIFLLFQYRYENKKRRDGRITGFLLTLVFSTRFLLEFFKTRQATFGGEMVLSMGQVLSLPMVFIGLVLLLRSMDIGAPWKKPG